MLCLLYVSVLSIHGEMNRAKELSNLSPNETLICTASVIMVLLFFNYTNKYKQNLSISGILNLHMTFLWQSRTKLFLFWHVFIPRAFHFSPIIVWITTVDKSSLSPRSWRWCFVDLQLLNRHSNLVQFLRKRFNVEYYDLQPSAMNCCPYL